jgi:hypothetical protein
MVNRMSYHESLSGSDPWTDMLADDPGPGTAETQEQKLRDDARIRRWQERRAEHERSTQTPQGSLLRRLFSFFAA